MNDRSALIVKSQLRWNLVPIIRTIRYDEHPFARRLVFIKPHELEAAKEKYGDDLHIWEFDDESRGMEGLNDA